MGSANAARPSHPLVWIVLVNWNGWIETSACLQALEVLDYPRRHVVVVDNASDDGSVHELRRQFPEAQIIARNSNDGFATGCNEGIWRAVEAEADYVWLLNNDAVPRPGALSALVDTAEKSEALAVVGSVIETGPGSEVVWGGGWVNLWTGRSAHHHESVPAQQLDFVTGASMLLRRQAITSAGALDERFFLFFEDVELCVRYRRAGWMLDVSADSRIVHAGGASSDRVADRTLARYRTDSLLILLLTHGRWPIVASALATLLRMLALGRRRRWRQAWWALTDAIRFSRF